MREKMSGLAYLKKAKHNKKTYRSFKTIEPGRYPVLSFAHVHDQCGENLRVRTKDFYINLPQRFLMNLNQKILDKLNTERLVMVYSGKDEANNNRVIVDFDEFRSSDEFED